MLTYQAVLELMNAMPSPTVKWERASSNPQATVIEKKKELLTCVVIVCCRLRSQLTRSCSAYLLRNDIIMSKAIVSHGRCSKALRGDCSCDSKTCKLRSNYCAFDRSTQPGTTLQECTLKKMRATEKISWKNDARKNETFVLQSYHCCTCTVTKVYQNSILEENRHGCTMQDTSCWGSYGAGGASWTARQRRHQYRKDPLQDTNQG
jgi:hypothetical protein